MPSHIIDIVNKMGVADSNMALKFQDQQKTKHVSDEEVNLEVNTGKDQINDTEANFLGVEICTTVKIFDELEFQKEDVDEKAEESKKNTIELNEMMA